MVKHVILWQLKDEVDKELVKKEIKKGLEGLKGEIAGLIDIKVNIEAYPSSNSDLMLDSKFENYEALLAYRDHPKHVEVANSKVRPNVKSRIVLDYDED